MSRYVLLLTGEGEGCDYCIECNKAWKFIEAENDVELQDKIRRVVDGYSQPGIAKVKVIKIASETEFDIKAYRTVLREEKERQRAEREQNIKKAQYEKLKAEFGDAK